MKSSRKYKIFEYGLWLIFGLLILILIKYLPGIVLNPIIFVGLFFYILILPGYLLAKIFRINVDDLTGQILIDIALGLSFYLIINLAAMFLSLSPAFLEKIILIIGIILFMWAWLKEVYSSKLKTNINFKINFKSWKNLIYLLPIGFGFFILYIVNLKGPGLDGDPYLHLSVIRKAFEGDFLNPGSLAFTKAAPSNPAYLYPVWHVFLAFLSKVLLLDPLIIWTKVLLTLTIILILVWYWFIKKIFVQNLWSILALMIFLVTTFYSGTGYIFTRLSVPDTLSQFIILPLGLAIGLEYIFSKKKDFKLLIPIGLLGVISLLVHGPHYFYFLFLFVIYAIFYAIFAINNFDYKNTLLKISHVILAIFFPFVIIIIALQLRFGSITAILGEFDKVSAPQIKAQFTRFGLLYRYGYLALPLALPFIKQKRILFIISSLALGPLIYWTPLGDSLGKLLSYVFIERLLDNSSYYFLIFALVLGLVVVVIDRMFSLLSILKQRLVLAIIGVLFVLAVILEISFQAISGFSYNILYGKSTSAFFNNHIGYFFINAILITFILIAIWYKLSRKDFELEKIEFRNYFTDTLVVAFIAFFIFAPSSEYLRVYLPNPLKIDPSKYFLQRLNYDAKALGYVKNNIPVRAVIFADDDATRSLSVLSTQYMASNPGSSYQKNLDQVFSGDLSYDQNKELIFSSKYAIDYIYIKDPDIENNIYFSQNPDLYKLVYQGQTIIYQVIK